MLRYEVERGKLARRVKHLDLSGGCVSIFKTESVRGIRGGNRVYKRRLWWVGRFLMAPALGLGLFLLLSSWLSYASSDVKLRTAGATAVLPDQVETLLTPDPRITALMGQITTGTVVALEQSLTGELAVLIGGDPYTIHTRYSDSGEPISKAIQYAYERFQDLGLDVALHEYNYAGNDWRNVVAERRGLRRSDEVLLITAHLDDLPPGMVAPGADDNASGSVAVLVAADVLSHVDFDCTLRFVLFTGEEQGLRGSAAYAADVAAATDDVRGVLNLDMIGYNSDAEPIIDLHVRSAISDSVVIAETFSQVVGAYDLNLTPDILVDNFLGNFSDNKSFWDQGYPAILAIEDNDDFTPYYHTIDDALDTLNLDFFTEAVRAAVGTFAHMGCLSTGLLAGTVTTSDTGLPVSSTVTAIALDSVYTTTTNANGYFALSLPLYTFTVGASANVAGYLPGVTTEVVIVADHPAAQNFRLMPWPSKVLVPILLKQP